MSSTSTAGAGPQSQAKHAPPKPLPKRNPVAEMMGLPRLRLPSRNWLIFLSITGGFFGAVQYDRREKKRAQKKWCDLVSHLAHDPLPISQTRRKLTIFLAAPPGDSLRTTRDYFREYIKPVLVAAALDYDVIEGRKEGDVRYGTAEQIRRLRQKNGEKGQTATVEGGDPEQIIDLQRTKMAIRDEPGPRGDLVIGRHTWKEYVRGVHEGWLGSLDQPAPPPKPEPEVTPDAPLNTSTTAHPILDPEMPRNKTSEASDSDLDATKPMAEIEEPTPNSPEKLEDEPKPLDPRASYIAPSAYNTSSLAPTTPPTLEASAPIPQPHILGFLNTPIRIYRYLNQRHLADRIGRETAAIVLGLSDPYEESESTDSLGDPNLDATPVATKAPESDSILDTLQTKWQQTGLLQQEESEWHKSVRKPRTDDLERTWLDDVVMDPRIAERMRKFNLDRVEGERAERIAKGMEKPIGWREKDAELKTIVGNLEDPDA